jgi:uracil-DNA glycosylase family 4
MTTLLQRYLAYQRDIGVDEIILPEPWVEPSPTPMPSALDSKRSQASGEGVPAPALRSQAMGAKPVADLDGTENPEEAIRKITAQLSGAGVKTSPSRAEADSIDPAKSPLKKENPEAKAQPILEFANVQAWREAFMQAAPGLHPMGAGRQAGAWVLSRGVSAPLFAVVALQPSAEADDQSGPFAGAEGLLLEKMLRAMKLEPQEMLYTSLMRVRHAGRGWARKDIAKAVPWLAAELRLVRPQFVLAMGEDVAQILARVGQGYEALRQKSWEFAGFELAMTWDPATLLAKEELKKEAWRDLQWLMKRVEEKEATS